MAGSKTETNPKLEMKVLALGLPRTGSASIAQALTTLGYKDVHHGLKILDSPRDWSILNRAADASYPILPTYTGKPFEREEWDELFGTCEASTDIAAFFAPQLIKAYPDAKVILVTRDFDKWYGSIEAVVKLFWSFPCQLAFNYLGRFVDPFFGRAVNKLLVGLFEARDVEELRQNARMVYDRHYHQIRELVPPHRLLEYRMGQGWEPICNFLDKPVPNMEFPWLNEADAMRMLIKRKMRSQLIAAGRVLVPRVVGVFTVLAAGWMVTKTTWYLNIV
ncbi:hypothetical protein HIM_10379 [Hirsutella minnesotensis 3608]|uniref:NAD dependent epimerase/dehydratase n=1 Tax=Hirsutella minnesotensis 3608 TaxID=1043627 RepID=A0A0F7ZG41_9HYPO|nr:hypothetical protein HIM_10379 [Hirsutella minnesotensis 3608]